MTRLILLLVIVLPMLAGCRGPIEQSDPSNNFANDRDKRRAAKIAATPGHAPATGN